MKIALDYDGTFTLAPAFWSQFIHDVKEAGHDVRIVTARDNQLDLNDELHWLDAMRAHVIFTSGIAKRFYCEHFAKWVPDVWIDDKPESIIDNSKMTPEQLAEWRATRAQ